MLFSMNKKYDKTLINTVVAEHSGGQSVAILCAHYTLPRSTVYFWIKQNQIIIANEYKAR
jgi:Transposase.